MELQIYRKKNQMPVSVRSQIIEKSKKFVTEKEIFLNSIYMMLGVNSDFFILHSSLDNATIITVHSQYVCGVQCTHLSSGAVKSILSKFAQIGTSFEKLRWIHRNARFDNRSPTAALVEQLISRQKTIIEQFLQEELNGPRTSLLALLCKVKPLSLRAKTASGFTSYLIAPHGQEEPGNHQSSFVLPVNDLEREILRDFDELSRTQNDVCSDTWSPRIVEEPDEPTLNAKTESHFPKSSSFFIFYIRENRIVAL